MFGFLDRSFDKAMDFMENNDINFNFTSSSGERIFNSTPSGENINFGAEISVRPKNQKRIEGNKNYTLDLD